MTTAAPQGAPEAAPTVQARPVWPRLALLAPTGVVAAGGYYYGRVSAAAFYSWFGVSLSALDLSTVDYQTAVPQAFFRPLVVLLLVVALALAVHQAVDHRAGRWRPTTARAAALGVGTCGAALVLLGLLGLAVRLPRLLAPLSLLGGVLLVEYAWWWHSRSDDGPRTASRTAEVRRGTSTAAALVAAFWVLTLVAQDSGEQRARIVERSLPLQSQAVVYSQQRLELPLPARRLTVLPGGEEAAYRYRYNGLRTLVRADGRWFLLPVEWRHDNGASVIVLDDQPGRVRVDLAP